MTLGKILQYNILIQNMGGISMEEKGYKIKELLKNKKVLIIPVLLVMIIGFKIAYDEYGVGMSDDTKQDKIMDVLANKDYDKARKKTERLLKNNTSLKNVAIELISLYEDAGVGTAEEYSLYMQNKAKEIKQQIQDDVNKIYIENLKQIENSPKATFNIVNPTNRDISYMEMSVDYLDGNNNIISSGFTNETNVMANSKRLKEIYLSIPNGTKNFNVKVNNVTFK